MVSFIFVYLALQNVEYRNLEQIILSVRIFPFLPFAVMFYLVGHFVRGIRLKWLLSKEVRIGIWTCTNVVVLGYAINNILPARLGEFARAGMLSERAGITYMHSLVLTLIERILDGMVILGLLFISLFFFPGLEDYREVIEVPAIIIGLGGIFLIFSLFASPKLYMHWS